MEGSEAGGSRPAVVPGGASLAPAHPPALRRGAGDARRSFEDLLSDCVHCGFCLPACPTYLLWGEEMDSPRGRIHLMAQAAAGAPLAGALTGHLDACLSCLGCMTACPSGVRYDELIEHTRARIESEVPRRPAERALRSVLFAFFPYRRRLALARAGLGLAERSGLRRLSRRPSIAPRLPAVVQAMESIAPPLRPVEAVPERSAAQGERRGSVAMLTGCVQHVLFSHVNAATARVLAAEGFEVLAPRSQGCCGALSGHAGRREEAARFAKKLIGELGALGADAVVVNAAGCGSAMKEYGRLLAGDPRWRARGEAFSASVRDLSELLDEVGPRAERHRLEKVVAYQDACHLAHAQGIRSAPRRLLAGIPGLEVRELAERELCCGSAGVYNLLQPAPARQLGDRKGADVLSTGAAALVSANPGCLMQIRAATQRAGRPVEAFHLAEVLDASIRGTGLR